MGCVVMIIDFLISHREKFLILTIFTYSIKFGMIHISWLNPSRTGEHSIVIGNRTINIIKIKVYFIFIIYFFFSWWVISLFFLSRLALAKLLIFSKNLLS